MGGFAGGDEAGYWDEDEVLIFKSSKKNLGESGLKPSTYLSLIPCKCDKFTIDSKAKENINSNDIHKAYEALCEYTQDSDIEDFFKTHMLRVSKECSSNVLSFLHLVRDECNLLLSNSELEDIANTIK